MALRNIRIEDMLTDAAVRHLAVLGMTGSGKSVLLNQIGTWAARQGHRVIYLDAYRGAAGLAQSPGVRTIGVTSDRRLNPLDVVYDEEDKAQQIQYGIGVVSDLLGCQLPSEELGALEVALTQLYASCTPETPLESMPILSDLIHVLEQQDEPESISVASAVRDVLFDTSEPTVLSVAGKWFNGTTTEPWDFISSVTVIDTITVSKRLRRLVESHVNNGVTVLDTSVMPESWRSLVEVHALGALLHFLKGLRRILRSQAQDRTTYLLIDPLDELVRNAVGRRLLVDIARRAKPLDLRIVAVVQSPASFLNSIHNQFLWENAHKVLFRLRGDDAQRVASVLPLLQAEHLRVLHEATPGRGFIVSDNAVQSLGVMLPQRGY